MEISNTKVLIVDDFPLVRKIVVDSLTNMGFKELHEASSGEEAIGLLEKNMKDESPFQLIFLDWNMPGKNGMDVLEYCRNTPDLLDVPIIMLTAEGEKKQVLRAFSAGVNDYIVKPCSANIIQKKVKNLIEKKLSKAS